MTTHDRPKGAKVGSWVIETRKIISDNGIDDGYWISDGEREMITTEDPIELMIAIAQLLGVNKFEPSRKLP
jgi:hypothetical protein